MTEYSEDQRFYYRSSKQEFKNLSVILVFWVGTVLLGASSRDTLQGKYLLLLSLVYPLIIIISILRRVKSLSYIEIGAHGLKVSLYGVLRKTVHWQDIEQPLIIAVNKGDAVAFNYLPSHKRGGWAVGKRVKTFGYEEVFTQAYAVDGRTLTDASLDYYAKATAKARKSVHGPGRQKTDIAPIVLEYSHKYSDLWTRPHTLAWLGGSLICSIFAAQLRARNHGLSSVLSLIAFICIGFAGSSMARYRRVAQATQKKQKPKEPNDWSNMM